MSVFELKQKAENAVAGHTDYEISSCLKYTMYKELSKYNSTEQISINWANIMN